MNKITILLVTYCLFANALPWATNANLSNVTLEKRAPGEYQFFATGIVPGIVSVLIPKTGKVVMLERKEGFVGTTHSQVVDVQSAGVRQLTLPGDNFCSGGFITPDPSARLYNVGNNDVSFNSIMQYLPCGTPGSSAADKCDWLEMGPMVQLIVGRWYPATLPMPNGKVAIFSGTNYPVGIPDLPPPEAQPTLEWIPSTGSYTTVPFLVDNLGWNLYPFNFVLTDGSVFLMAGNNAAVVNPTNFAVIKTLPSSYVNGVAAFRTYPHGAGNALLPLRPSNNYASEVIICGGNTQDFRTTVALTDCSRMFPLSANPVWDQENMPGPRTLIDMILLPDGTVLMVNGAREGASGYNNYINPEQTAWLYNPTAAKGSRFSIGGTSNIPRLYHSSALLLEDGRVMIAGSTPNGYADAPNQIWPDEVRLETYSPPYLLNGLSRPSISSISSSTWGYGSSIGFTVTIPSGVTTTITAVLFTNGFVTHTVHMGQRLVELVVTVTGTNALTVVSPPNANVAPPGWYMVFILDGPTPSVAKWVLLGNDPANLASWPGDAPPPSQCQTPVLSRKSCGDVSFTQNDCIKSRCCWDSTLNTCFKGEGFCTANLDVLSRVDCGPIVGSSEASCIAGGCCWGPITVLGAWCYGKSFPASFASVQPPPPPPPSTLTTACVANLAVTSRIDCGAVVGSSSTSCAAGGCCWGPLTVPGPWCYKAAGTCDANLAVASRIDCGATLGASSTSCTAGGCCWGPLTVPGPWCFKPASSDPPPPPTPPPPPPTNPTTACVANLAVASRIDCGATLGASSTTCAAGGCCWAPLTGPGPWCYKAAGTCDANLAVSSRIDCGATLGASSTSCTAGGCCWGPLTVPGPWCFKPISSDPTGTCVANLAVASRIDCGAAVGSSSTSCAAGGCCWGPLTVPGPWCYKRSNI